MKHQYLDLVADGATQDWAFTGKPTAWEACFRGSTDSFYIYSATLNHVAQLNVAQGSPPVYGFVSKVTLHYRVRSTVDIAAPNVTLSLIHDGNVILGPVFSATDTNWHDEYFQVPSYNPGVATRFTATDIADLVINLEITTAPVAGQFEVSEAWIELEFCDAHEFYDPVTTVATPDAVPGYLQWNTAGGEAQALTLFDTLSFVDTSNVDYRRYWRSLEHYGYPTATEVALDFLDSGYGGVLPNKTCILRLAQIDDGTRSVWLTLVQDRTILGVFQWHLGLTGFGLDVHDVDVYIASHQLTALEIASFNHVVITVDRNEDPGNPGIVEVKLNQQTILMATYLDFPLSPLQSLGFGNGAIGDTTMTGSVAFMNFWSWRHYQVAGPKFAAWEADVGSNNSLVPNATDYAIAKFVPVPGPYTGTMVGQSDYCCELVAADTTQLCSVYQLWKFPGTAAAYNIFVDYRTTVFGIIAELLVQRTSDFQYWDQAGGAWAVGEVSRTLPAAMTRQYAYGAMTNIPDIPGDGLLVRIRTLGGAPAYSVIVYKVLLQAV